jgi:hypothetical protein
MHKNMRSKTGLAAVAIAAICGGGWWASTVRASDHDESPLVKKDAAQDITDLYVFDSGTGKTTIIVCWAGFNDSRPQPDTPAVYDANALYTIHVDNNGDNKADHDDLLALRANDQDQWGVQWEGVPGAEGARGRGDDLRRRRLRARLDRTRGRPVLLRRGRVPDDARHRDRDLRQHPRLPGRAQRHRRGDRDRHGRPDRGGNPMQVWVTASRKK